MEHFNRLVSTVPDGIYIVVVPQSAQINIVMKCGNDYVERKNDDIEMPGVMACMIPGGFSDCSRQRPTSDDGDTMDRIHSHVNSLISVSNAAIDSMISSKDGLSP